MSFAILRIRFLLLLLWYSDFLLLFVLCHYFIRVAVFRKMRAKIGRFACAFGFGLPNVNGYICKFFTSRCIQQAAKKKTAAVLPFPELLRRLPFS